MTLASILSLALFSCSKDKDDASTLTTETPIQTILIGTTVFKETKIVTANVSVETGYKFSAKKAGKIAQLGCKFPIAGNVKVTLWDYETKEAIKTVTINVTDITKFIYVDIEDIAITANKNYVITLNNTIDGMYKNFYSATTINADEIPAYPFVSGSIEVKAAMYKQSPNTVFPIVEEAFAGYLTGMPDFVFEY